jgi:hypothetical protein
MPRKEAWTRRSLAAIVTDAVETHKIRPNARHQALAMDRKIFPADVPCCRKLTARRDAAATVPVWSMDGLEFFQVILNTNS